MNNLEDFKGAITKGESITPSIKSPDEGKPFKKPFN